MLAALLAVLLAMACKSPSKKEGGGTGKKNAKMWGGSVFWLQPVDAKSAVVVRMFKTRHVVSLEHVDRGVVWKKPAHPAVGSTVGDGLVTLRYHQPGINVPKVEYGVVGRRLSDGKPQWRFIAPKRLTSSMFNPTFSRRAGHQLFERFSDPKGLAHVLALDRRTGKLQWERTVGAKGDDPFILHTGAKLLVLVIGTSRWLVLNRTDGKTVLKKSIHKSTRLGSCVHRGRFLYLQPDGLHALSLKTGQDTLLNAGFWGTQDKGGPRKLLACGSYQGQLIFALTVVNKFMGPERHVIAGVSDTGKIQWRIPLGSWAPGKQTLSSRSQTAPFTGPQQRFVPFIARDTKNAHLNLRLMIVDLQERKVAARGAIQETLLNWHSHAVPPNRYLLRRFNTWALFDGTTGRLLSGVRCPGPSARHARARHGVVWICGARKSGGRWSLRKAKTFEPAPGRHNTLRVPDVKSELTKFFGLKR